MIPSIPIDFSVDDSRSALTALLTRLKGSLSTHDAAHLDLAKCGYLGPMFTSLVAVWSERLRAAGATLTATAPEKAHLATYVNWAGLAERLQIGGPPELAPDATTLPVAVFSKAGADTTRSLSEHVHALIPMGVQERAAFEMAVNALCQNVQDHAGGPGALAARVFTTRKEVRVCVADLGVGVRASLAPLHGELTDRKALEQAVGPQVSGQTPDPNAGQRLHQLDALVQRNGGQMLLASGKATRYRDRARIRFDELPKGISFPGTLCLVTFNVDGTL